MSLTIFVSKLPLRPAVLTLALALSAMAAGVYALDRKQTVVDAQQGDILRRLDRMEDKLDELIRQKEAK